MASLRYGLTVTTAFLVAVVIGGCRSPRLEAVPPPVSNVSSRVQELEAKLKKSREAKEQAESKLQQMRADLNSAQQQTVKCNAATEECKNKVAAKSPAAIGLPDDPKPGVCYAQLYFPPEYTTRAESLVVKPAHTHYTVSDAEFTGESVRVMTAGEAVRVVRVEPARYEMQEERVKIRDAYHRFNTQHATFKHVSAVCGCRPVT